MTSKPADLSGVRFVVDPYDDSGAGLLFDRIPDVISLELKFQYCLTCYLDRNLVEN